MSSWLFQLLWGKYKKTVLFCVIALLLSLAGVTAVNKSHAAFYQDNPAKLHFDVYATTQRDLTVEQMMSFPFEDRFISHTKPYFNFGLTTDIHWIRFRLPPLEAINIDECYNPEMVLAFDYMIKDIQLFIPLRGTKQYTHLQGGYGKHDGTDELPGLTPAFLIPDNYNPGAYAFIRIYTTASSGFQISMTDRSSYEGATQLRVLFLGLLAGLLAAMAVYNLLLYIALRYKQYLFYVLFTLAILLYQSAITGLIRIVDPETGNYLFNNGELLSFIAVIFWLLFTYTYLNVSEKITPFKRVYHFFFALPAVGIVLYHLEGGFAANLMAYVLGLGLPVLGILTVIASKRRGYRVSPFYLAGIILLIGGVLIFALRGWNVIGHSLWIIYGIFIAVALESMLYAFALADQVRELYRQNYTLQQQRTELVKISVLDELTGLYNKRHFNNTFRRELTTAREKDSPLSLMLLDIDRFKGINDQYGHAKGDEVLKRLGFVVQETIGKQGYACRVGGEEFAVLLPGFKLDDAAALAEKLRQDFARESFTISTDNTISCTISLGVAQLQGVETADDFYDRVDQALYKSKYEGRNRVSVV